MELLLLVLLLAVFLGLPMLQMRKQTKQIGLIRAFQASLTPGMVVELTSGLHGRLTSVGETTVDVDIAPGVTTTWDRAAVLKLVDSVQADSTEADHLTAGSTGDAPFAEEIPDDLSALDDTPGEEDRTGGGDADRG